MTHRPSQIFRALLATAIMALAANCFLKYLWWTACYSAWYGIPKLSERWKAAGAHASFNGWSVIVLDAASVAVLFGLIRLRSIKTSALLKNAIRLALSLTFTITVTAALALALSWLKQGIH
jgi:hypothetical protein